MEIRPGSATDGPRIAALHTESWQAAYAGIMPAVYLAGPLREEHARLWRTRLRAEGPGAGSAGEKAHLLVADDSAAPRLGGFAYVIPQDDGRVLLDNLHVAPGLVGTGVGRRLLHRVFAWSAAEHPGRPVYLEVLRDNVRATAFYSRQGGRPTAERTERFPAGFALAEIEYTWTADDVAGRAGHGGTPA